MIRVGFLMNYPTSYNAALNYFRNLFFSMHTYLEKEVEVYLFVPKNIAQEYIDPFIPFVKIIKTNVLVRKNPSWFIDKSIEKLFSFNPLLDNLLLKHKIDVVSHSSFVSKKVKTINWIMDFQHIHYPGLWTQTEMEATKKFLHRLIINSDRIVVSSFSALDDFKREYPKLSANVDVLHFVCQPNQTLRVKLTEEEETNLSSKYAINRSFFYLPNQFWSHKNHMIVFKAIKILKERGLNPLLLNSGLMNDFRSKKGHINDLRQYITDHTLESNILFLGLIPYHDVLDLVILSKAVINPSLFEGWSSTVEESKTMGKRLILSDIKVHREQNPELGVFFDPHNEIELADIMESLMKEEPIISNLDTLKVNLALRTKKFAEDFLHTLKEVCKTGNDDDN